MKLVAVREARPANALRGKAGIALRVISLPGSEERRAFMRQQLAGVAGLDWSFADALTELPDYLEHDPATVRNTILRDMTPGEIGCFSSHIALWRWFVAEPAGQAYEVLMVFEDDVLIDPRFLASLDRFCAAFPNTPFVRLHAKAPTPARPIGAVMGRHIVRYRGIAFGTQGYMLRRAGAQRLLASITAITRPIDDEMDRYWQHGIPNIGVHPSPLVEVGFASTIEAVRRMQTRPTRAAWLRWKAGRAVESLRRRAADIRFAMREPAL